MRSSQARGEDGVADDSEGSEDDGHAPEPVELGEGGFGKVFQGTYLGRPGQNRRTHPSALRCRNVAQIHFSPGRQHLAGTRAAREKDFGGRGKK